MKRNTKNEKKLLEEMISSSKSYEDKIAVLRFLTKKNATSISSVVSSSLKKKNNYARSNSF